MIHHLFIIYLFNRCVRYLLRPDQMSIYSLVNVLAMPSTTVSLLSHPNSDYQDGAEPELNIIEADYRAKCISIRE